MILSSEVTEIDRLQIKGESARMPEAVDFIKACMERRKVPRKDVVRTMVLGEEVLEKLIACAPEGAPVDIEVGGGFGSVVLRFSAAGEAFDIDSIGNQMNMLDSAGYDEEANDAIRRMMQKLIGNRLECRNKGGVNRVVIRGRRSPYAGLIATLLALALGVAVGFAMQKLLPGSTAQAVSANVFTPIYTVFMNALKMIVGPLVFCSVASSIADFGDLKAHRGARDRAVPDHLGAGHRRGAFDLSRVPDRQSLAGLGGHGRRQRHHRQGRGRHDLAARHARGHRTHRHHHALPEVGHAAADIHGGDTGHDGGHPLELKARPAQGAGHAERRLLADHGQAGVVHTAGGILLDGEDDDRDGPVQAGERAGLGAGDLLGRHTDDRHLPCAADAAGAGQPAEVPVQVLPRDGGGVHVLLQQRGAALVGQAVR